MAGSSSLLINKHPLFYWHEFYEIFETNQEPPLWIEFTIHDPIDLSQLPFENTLPKLIAIQMYGKNARKDASTSSASSNVPDWLF